MFFNHSGTLSISRFSANDKKLFEERNSLKRIYIKLIINHLGIYEKDRRVGGDCNLFSGLEQNRSFIPNPGRDC